MDFIFPVRSCNNTDSPIGLLDLENIVIAVGISFLSCLQAEIEVYPVLDAVILDFSLPVESCNISGSSIGQVDQKIINYAFEISFLCCLRANVFS